MDQRKKILETIFSNAEDFFEALHKDIESAKETIHLETYIFHNDIIGKKISNALIKAAKNQVQVNVLIDGAGSPSWGGSLPKKLEKAGVNIRIFHPFPWIFWQWRHAVAHLPFFAQSLYSLLKMNSRNHRKTCLIDNKIAYVGSFNITQCHLGKKNGGQGWRDMAVRLQNVNVKNLKSAIEAAWENKAVKERIKEVFQQINKNPVFRLNNSWYRRRILYRNLLRRIGRCKKRIWITNAYFIPDSVLLKKIKDAARNHRDVRILLPRNSDVIILPWASTIFYEKLLKSGVRIFEYLPGMLHAKTLIIDDWMTIGSSNLNHRSLLHDLEVDVNVQLPQSKQQIEQNFLDDLNQSKEIKLDNWEKRPMYQRIIGRIMLYAKFWI